MTKSDSSLRHCLGGITLKKNWVTNATYFPSYFWLCYSFQGSCFLTPSPFTVPSVALQAITGGGAAQWVHDIGVWVEVLGCMYALTKVSYFLHLMFLGLWSTLCVYDFSLASKHGCKASCPIGRATEFLQPPQASNGVVGIQYLWNWAVEVPLIWGVRVW